MDGFRTNPVDQTLLEISITNHNYTCTFFLNRSLIGLCPKGQIYQTSKTSYIKCFESGKLATSTPTPHLLIPYKDNYPISIIFVIVIIIHS